MLILTLRTDKPEAEIALYEDNTLLNSLAWLANRQLAETIHKKIDELLASKGRKLDEVGGIVIYKGPGSFTGLRIGFSVANVLADALKIPIVSTAGEKWANDGTSRLKQGGNEKIALPEYGAEPKTTTPKK